MTSPHAKKAEKIREELGRQYKDKDFRFPTEYTAAEAANFLDIQKRMFEKRERLRSDDRDQDILPDDVYANEVDLLEDALPTAEGQEKFWLWVHNNDCKIRTMPKAGAFQDYFKALAQTDYSDKVSLRELFTVLKTHVYPYIPAGSYNGYRYRIVPSLTPLAPDEELVDWEDPRQVATDPIVAIDLAGQIIHSSDEVEDRNRRRRADISEESYFSSSSNNSTILGNSLTGFVCFQVGELRAAEEENWSDNGKLPKGQDVSKILWERTDWVLVLVISAESTAGAVWLLQNFNPTIEHTSDQYTITPGDPEDPYGWGYFEGERQLDLVPMQRGGVKIAHKITDLTETREWTMDEYITGKYEIVQAVLADRDEGKSPVIVRQLPRFESQDDSSPDVSRLRIEDD
ncbi:hypothetical protein GT037_009280 [Alternaria burnsii]|uniref:Uncharacterized protein n=1 Tax=Alternaria burnsii TaxID=1187904 RepID=A0A8H7AWA4_9PLEO|nr:uncharacterized protein GT037_009280 [Alternaria burnsii]KAF7672779.1 hypothetical protein GT037_009280 [Alternaria burnsii]